MDTSPAHITPCSRVRVQGNDKLWLTNFFVASTECLMHLLKINLAFIGRAKQAPQWAIQSRFRMIYVCRYVGLSMGNPYKKDVCQNAWEEVAQTCACSKSVLGS